MQLVNLIIGILTTYGLATLLSEYSGPFDIFYKLRRSRIGNLIECTVCVSVYLAIIPWIALDLSLMEYLAVVGGTIFLARQI